MGKEETVVAAGGDQYGQVNSLCLQFDLFCLSKRETQESLSKLASPGRVFYRAYLGGKGPQGALPTGIRAALALAQFR